MQLFDTHCHLTDERFEGDLAQVIARMRGAGMRLAVVVDDASKDDQKAIALAQEHDFLYAATGVHPHDASSWNGERAAKLETWLRLPKVVALGETGLDYHYDFSPRTVQREAFEAQLDMAYRLDKPAILHIREAHGDAQEVLTGLYRSGRLARAVMHCYSGSWESAKTYLDMGLYISFTGVVTFKNAAKLIEVARNMPLDRMMIETDCPYMAPEPMRGKRNEPQYVAYTAARIASVREMEAEMLAEETLKNGMRFFGID